MSMGILAGKLSSTISSAVSLAIEYLVKHFRLDAFGKPAVGVSNVNVCERYSVLSIARSAGLVAGIHGLAILRLLVWLQRRFRSTL